ncbi:Oxidoreductase molybdopterin binding protein [Streptomyces sp. GBA 94-10 4N24]|nr:Oxidoreductase molybdopterin binding protein [Streptomyces sp. GBA 94-10 4N24]UZN59972.1 Oxidoreductase molybdopterin binding protein [Streptomyces sp. GBA 94-10 4N24]WDV32133.1 hypothetical protein OIM90_14975 [Streptomyces sp. AD16]
MPEEAPVTSAARPPRPACSIVRLFPLVRSAGGTYRTVAGATRERGTPTRTRGCCPPLAPVLLAVRLDGALPDAPHLVSRPTGGARYASAATGIRLMRPGVPVAAGEGRLVSGAERADGHRSQPAETSRAYRRRMPRQPHPAGRVPRPAHRTPARPGPAPTAGAAS